MSSQVEPESFAELWPAEERQVFAPPEDLNAAEWAEKYRELTRRQSSRPGPWRNANQPAAVGLMILATHAAVREIWIKKSGQFGASEAVRNVLGRFAHLDPCPAMLVLPDEKVGRKLFSKRILPLFEDTPVLAKLRSGRGRDSKLTNVLLTNGFELSLAWAGSPSSLSADPYRIVVLDEVDKYVGVSAQADPVGESRARLRTFEENSLLLALSTPSTETGRVTVGYEACETKLDFYCPCPHCGQTFRPRFDALTWEKFAELLEAKQRAAKILARKAAWFECDACKAKLPASAPYPPGLRIEEHHRRAMYAAGWWATPDQGWRIYYDGRIEGDKPDGEKVGMHIHVLIDLSTKLWRIAAKFVACDGNKSELKDFYNVDLGLEFREQTSATTVNVFSRRCVPNVETGFTPAPARVVPKWASRLVMTVDTQKSYFWYLIRAWGHGLRSQRIHHGRAATFEEIEDLYNAAWPYQDDAYSPIKCFGSAPLAIDSGGGMDQGEHENSITAKVYDWCLKNPTWRYPIKGASKTFDEHIRWRDITYQPPGQGKPPMQVRLHLLDGNYWRDLLNGYIASKTQIVDPTTGELLGEADQWLLNDRNDDEYNRHLAEVHKVRVKKGRAFIERYQPKTPGARHDYHDLEAYQIAWAHGPANCTALPSPKQMEQARQAAQAVQQQPKNTGGIRMPRWSAVSGQPPQADLNPVHPKARSIMAKANKPAEKKTAPETPTPEPTPAQDLMAEQNAVSKTTSETAPEPVEPLATPADGQTSAAPAATTPTETPAAGETTVATPGPTSTEPTEPTEIIEPEAEQSETVQPPTPPPEPTIDEIFRRAAHLRDQPHDGRFRLREVDVYLSPEESDLQAHLFRALEEAGVKLETQRRVYPWLLRQILKAM